MVLKRGQTAKLQEDDQSKSKSSVGLLAHCRAKFVRKCQSCLQNNFFHASLIAAVPATIAGIMSSLRLSNPEFFPPWLFNIDSQCYSMLGWVLGFVLVFRTGQAYSRFWSGSELMHQLGADWYHSCSQIICFAETSHADPVLRYSFQLTVIRLYSLLHCSALKQITDVEDENLELIDPKGLGMERLQYVRSKPAAHGVEVVCQWIQGSLLEALNVGLVKTPPPIVSRVFQELHSGVVLLSQMQNIKETHFPSPYGQMIHILLLVHACVTPFFMAKFTSHWVWASIFAFIGVFTLWIITFIAIEIEMPFGGDDEDIDFPFTQLDFNERLLALVEPEMRVSPEIDLYLHESEYADACISDDPAEYSFRPRTSGHDEPPRSSTSSAGMSKVKDADGTGTASANWMSQTVSRPSSAFTASVVMSTNIFTPIHFTLSGASGASGAERNSVVASNRQSRASQGAYRTSQGASHATRNSEFGPQLSAVVESDNEFNSQLSAVAESPSASHSLTVADENRGPDPARHVTPPQGNESGKLNANRHADPPSNFRQSYLGTSHVPPRASQLGPVAQGIFVAPSLPTTNMSSLFAKDENEPPAKAPRRSKGVFASIGLVKKKDRKSKGHRTSTVPQASAFSSIPQNCTDRPSVKGNGQTTAKKVVPAVPSVYVQQSQELYEDQSIELAGRDKDKVVTAKGAASATTVAAGQEHGASIEMIDKNMLDSSKAGYGTADFGSPSQELV